MFALLQLLGPTQNLSKKGPFSFLDLITTYVQVPLIEEKLVRHKFSFKDIFSVPPKFVSDLSNIKCLSIQNQTEHSFGPAHFRKRIETHM